MIRILINILIALVLIALIWFVLTRFICPMF
jgi:hypothetical protein